MLAGVPIYTHTGCGSAKVYVQVQVHMGVGLRVSWVSGQFQIY